MQMSGRSFRPPLTSRLARRPLSAASRVAPTDYRKIVLEVAAGLRPEDREELCFAVKDSVLSEAGGKRLTGIGLVECLERHGLLGPRNCAFLVRCLNNMGRRDLAEFLAPPEEFRSTACTLVHSSALLPAARTAFPQWTVSSFRKVVLDVSRELNEEEVEKICWLSKDFLTGSPRSEEMSSVDLLHAMEDSNLLGPGNYSFLVDCLEQIGRLDLVSLIQPPKLPYLPPSCTIEAQMLQKRMETLSLKKTQHIFGMRSLVLVRDSVSQLITQKGTGFFQRTCDSVSPKLVTVHSSYIIENLPTTLINMSLLTNSLLDAVEELNHKGHTQKFIDYISDCEKHLDIIQSLMEGIGWDIRPRKRENMSTSRQYHPVRQTSYGAFSGLVELALELSSNWEKVQEETRHLNSVLLHIESILHVAGYMWSVTSWLIALFQVAVYTPINLGRHEGLFRILADRNKRIIANNSDMIESVLNRTRVGSKLLDELRTKMINYMSLRDSCNSTSTILQTAIIPIPVFAFIIILLSEHPSLAPEDFEEIVASLKQYMEGKAELFYQMYRMVTTMVLDGIFSNVESFRQSRMQELSHNCDDIAGIFGF